MAEDENYLESGQSRLRHATLDRVWTIMVQFRVDPFPESGQAGLTRFPALDWDSARGSGFRVIGTPDPRRAHWPLTLALVVWLVWFVAWGTH